MESFTMPARRFQEMSKDLLLMIADRRGVILRVSPQSTS